MFLCNRDGRAPRRAAHPPNSAGAGTQGADPYREQVRIRVGCRPPSPAWPNLLLSFPTAQALRLPGICLDVLTLNIVCLPQNAVVSDPGVVCMLVVFEHTVTEVFSFLAVHASSTHRTDQVLFDLLL